MGNHLYAIPEVKLYEEKRPNSKNYFDNIGIDFSKPTKSIYPTVNKIKKAISNTKLRISKEQYLNFYNEKGWCCGLEDENGKFLTPISVNNIDNDDEPIKELIEFPRGDWDIIIIFLKELVKICGNILLYFDAGTMSLVTDEKSIEQINKEIHL